MPNSQLSNSSTYDIHIDVTCSFCGHNQHILSVKTTCEQTFKYSRFYDNLSRICIIDGPPVVTIDYFCPHCQKRENVKYVEGMQVERGWFIDKRHLSNIAHGAPSRFENYVKPYRSKVVKGRCKWE